jgi:hypothetical protein
MESIDPRNARPIDRSADQWLDRAFQVNAKSRGDKGAGGASTYHRNPDDKNFLSWWDGKSQKLIDTMIVIDFSRSNDLVPGKIADKVPQTDGTLAGHELFHGTQRWAEVDDAATRVEREQQS